MLNTSLSLGTTNLIQHLGDPVVLTTTYKLAEDAYEDDEFLTLTDSFGLVVGSTINLGPEVIVVKGLSGNVVQLDEPITESYFKGAYITCTISTKALGIPRFKRITYELLEFIRKVRIPLGTVVNYGSIIQHFSEEFFVVGLDPGDHSVAITLKEINSSLYVYRPAGLIKSGDDSWGGTRVYNTIAEGERSYFQYNRSQMPPVRDTSRDPGYVVRGEFSAILSAEIKAVIGDSVIVSSLGETLKKGEDGIVLSDERYRVTGVNRFTHKNFLSIDMNYDAPK
jgi:hypothetical protein